MGNKCNRRVTQMAFLLLPRHEISSRKILGKRIGTGYSIDFVKWVIQSPDCKRTDVVITKLGNIVSYSNQVAMLTEMLYKKSKTTRSLNLIQAIGFCFLSPAFLKVKPRAYSHSLLILIRLF